MSGIALALILSGAVIVRGALKGLMPVDAFRDIFDRAKGGAGLPDALTAAQQLTWADRFGGEVPTVDPSQLGPQNPAQPQIHQSVKLRPE